MCAFALKGDFKLNDIKKLGCS